MQTVQRLKPFQSPSSFIFIDPDTAHHYGAHTREALTKQIVNYREQNGLAAIEALDVVLETYWCLQPQNIGKCKPMPLRRGWWQTFKGGIAILQNVFFGEDNMVSDEEAERRAAICITCPFNIFPDKKGFPAWADNLAEASTGGRRVSSHDKLGNCGVCSCNLRAKVFAKPPFNFSDKERQELPDFCWAKNL